ncbi:type I secretion C-terminal target domain-containing protein [Inquilinus limosus]|uniref:calcium-binding protein n=1 Tax=Inquilinus limosus TaxID=171674 RepID=UPI003F16F386
MLEHRPDTALTERLYGSAEGSRSDTARGERTCETWSDRWLGPAVAAPGSENEAKATGIWVGTEGDDVLFGDEGTDTLRGGGGTDLLHGGGGADLLDGGAGEDAVSYEDSVGGVVVNLRIGRGIGGDAGGDRYRDIEDIGGSAHNDLLIGDDSGNWLGGGDGDDVLIGGGGRDSLNGGAGEDTASYADSMEGVYVELDTGFGREGTAEGDRYQDIENVEGSAHGDVLIGDAGQNRLEGGGSDDELSGAAGADVLDGGLGRDELLGEEGDDTLMGGDDDDRLVGASGADRLDGGAGTDMVSYAGSGEHVRVDLGAGRGFGGEAEGDTYQDVEDVEGSAHDDVLIGNAATNRLVGGAGADVLDGGAGSDTVSYAKSVQGVIANLEVGRGALGDAEGDTYRDIENIEGTAMTDRLIGDAAANRLFGGDSSDTLDGGAGADLLDGGVGVDWASYAKSNQGVTVDLQANLGSDGDAEGDTYQDIENVEGSALSDMLRGTGGANQLEGGDGDDVLRGGAGADVLIGGAGADFADYRESSAGVWVDLRSGTGSGGDAAGDTLTGIENLRGSGRDDALIGDDRCNLINGELGDDTQTGHGGDDVLIGQDGNDMLIGGAGSDVLDGGAGVDWASYATSKQGVIVDLQGGQGSGGDAEGDTHRDIENVEGSAYCDALTGTSGSNQLEGGDGDDVLRGGAGADMLVGGAGVDFAGYQGSAAGVRIRLQTGEGVGGDAEGDTLMGIENIEGSSHDDILIGSDDGNSLVGGDGTDMLAGGDGADMLHGGGGADVLIGGAGLDSASYQGASSGVWVNLRSGTGAGGDAAGDTLAEIEDLYGSSWADQLSGDDGHNHIGGERGDDVLMGGGGDDVLSGEDGNDWLNGDDGKDTLIGGAGADRFIYRTLGDSEPGVVNRDHIQDFNRAEGDKIDLSEIDADTTTAGDQAFVFVGDDGFTGVAGQLVCYEITDSNGDTHVAGDVNGDSVPDFEIILVGDHELMAADFVL